MVDGRFEAGLFRWEVVLVVVVVVVDSADSDSDSDSDSGAVSQVGLVCVLAETACRI